MNFFQIGQKKINTCVYLIIIGGGLAGYRKLSRQRFALYGEAAHAVADNANRGHANFLGICNMSQDKKVFETIIILSNNV